MNKDFIDTIKIEEDQSLCIINMPVPLRSELLDKLPQGVTVTSRPVGRFSTVILFTNTKVELKLSWDRLFGALSENGSFWIVYPDKKSNLYNEITKSLIDGFLKEKNIHSSKVITFLSEWKAIEIVKA